MQFGIYRRRFIHDGFDKKDYSNSIKSDICEGLLVMLLFIIGQTYTIYPSLTLDEQTRLKSSTSDSNASLPCIWVRFCYYNHDVKDEPWSTVSMNTKALFRIPNLLNGNICEIMSHDQRLVIFRWPVSCDFNATQHYITLHKTKLTNYKSIHEIGAELAKLVKKATIAVVEVATPDSTQVQIQVVILEAAENYFNSQE